MKKKLQVFISSTFVDMRTERQAAVEAVLEAGHIPAGMELFAAADDSQMQTIRDWIDESDVFMLILGGRYGSIDKKSGKSYIELEYEYAEKRKKPHFAVVLSQTALEAKVRSHGPSVIETDNGPLMKGFRDRVTGKICHMFDDNNGLKVAVFKSLNRYAERLDLAGWVRSSEVVDARATLEEITRLQRENTELSQRVAFLDAAMSEARRIVDGPPVLSADASLLLATAAADDGSILYARYMGGANMQAGDRDFIHPKTNREEARWVAALEELVAHRFVEDAGSNGEIFKVTARGYQSAKRLEPPGASVPPG